MTDRSQLENDLRDALIQALGISCSLESIRQDLAIRRPEIVAAVSFNHALLHDATQLIRVCWEYDKGLESLREVALAALKGRKGLPRLSMAFEDALRAEAEESGPANISPLTSRIEYQIKDLPAWRKMLRKLASRHSNADSMLHDALQRALLDQVGEGDHRRRCPFLYPGRIEGWKDLLARNESSGDCLDPPLIDSLERQLKNPPAASPKAPRVGSLLVMVLALENGDYGYRSYVCLCDQPRKDSDWRGLNPKLPQETIKAKDWRSELEARLPIAIAGAKARLNEAGILELLLEFFLPKALLHEDVGSLSMPLYEGSQDRKVLRSLYPYVLRSSERFQMFQESKTCVLPHTLPLRWGAFHCRDNLAYWRHDRLFPGRLSSENAKRKQREALESWFQSIQGEYAAFAIKRIPNLPDDSEFLNLWLKELIHVCPAVAIWWRPGSTVSKKQRELFFTFSPNSDQSPFGDPAPPTGIGDQEIFSHRCDPLALFHTLARTVWLGVSQSGLRKACEELVLLVDTADRWPPPLEKGPVLDLSLQPMGEGSDAVLTVQADEILHF